MASRDGWAFGCERAVENDEALPVLPPHWHAGIRRVRCTGRSRRHRLLPLGGAGIERLVQRESRTNVCKPAGGTSISQLNPALLA